MLALHHEIYQYQEITQYGSHISVIALKYNIIKQATIFCQRRT